MNSSNAKNRSYRDRLSHTPLWTILTALGFLVVAVASYIALNMNPTGADTPVLLFEGRNFTLQPFDLMDAHDVCELESKEKLGESLLRYTMNPLSTRYQEKKKNYFVVLNADIGRIDLWEEVMIFCDVDPKSHSVSHLKVVYDSDTSIFSRAKNIFKKMVD